jgi:hypothetical protein
MTKLKESYEPIKRALDDLPTDLSGFKGLAFQRLFEAAVEDARVATQRPMPPTAGTVVPGAQAHGSGRFQTFLTTEGISLDSLASVLDIEGGQVLARTPGNNKAESQRRIAALLALANAYKTGDFYVSRETLVDACKAHAAYDSANFASNMSSHQFNGSIVFLRDPNGGYRISRPGEAYLADVVRLLLSGKDGGSNP